MESDDVDDGCYSDDLQGCVGPKSPTLKQMLTATVAPIDKKLGVLVDVHQKQFGVQQDIAAKQGELVALQQESNAIQSELQSIAQQQLAIQSRQLVVMEQQLVVQQQQLLVQRQQLLTQRQQLLANQIAATQLSIQTQLHLQDRMHRDVQRSRRSSAPRSPGLLARSRAPDQERT